MERLLENITLVRDILIGCDGCQGNAQALEGLIEEAEQALTDILNGKDPFGMITG